jgi:hypothetical protein
MQGNDLGNRLIPVEHQHRLASLHMFQVPGKVVFKLCDLSPFHMAILAILRTSVNAPCLRLEELRPGLSPLFLDRIFEGAWQQHGIVNSVALEVEVYCFPFCAYIQAGQKGLRCQALEKSTSAGALFPVRRAWI